VSKSTLIVSKLPGSVNQTALRPAGFVGSAIVFSEEIGYNRTHISQMKRGWSAMSVRNKLTGIGTGIVVLTLLLGTLAGCGGSGNGSGSAPAPKPEAVQEAYADYPRFTNKKVTEKNHILTLSNGENNQFAFVYTLSADGETLYQSEKLQPGQKEEWDILRNCTESCTLDITITAWSLSDDKEQNSVTQTIDLTLPKRAQ
jgi:hypothetical protein